MFTSIHCVQAGVFQMIFVTMDSIERTRAGESKNSTWKDNSESGHDLSKDL